jgi:glycosyltransferase involved in cell wall biosynthesis
VIHLNSPKIGGLGAVAARMNGVKKILYTNHGWPFREDRPHWQLILIRFFSWLTVFLGGTTIVLSETEKNFVRGWPFISKKLTVVPIGLAPFKARTKKDALEELVGVARAATWIKEKWTVIGTISELHRNKGLTYAIDGIRQYIDHIEHGTTGVKAKIAYVIIGEGERRKNIEQRIAEQRLSDHVILAGHVDEAREYLAAFDMFLLSSVKEGLPYAVLEAGYVGVPVISTSVGGIPEVIQNLDNGLLIAPGRPQQISNALVYIDEHGEIKDRMTAKFKKRIVDEYSFDSVVKKIKSLYTAQRPTKPKLR